jgi:hypothetical protein
MQTNDKILCEAKTSTMKSQHLMTRDALNSSVAISASRTSGIKGKSLRERDG